MSDRFDCSKMEATQNRDCLDCPFCTFSNHDHNELLLHVNNVHAEHLQQHASPLEGADPHSSREQASTTASVPDHTVWKDTEFFECQCGEVCIAADCQSHLDLHYAEDISFDEIHDRSYDVTKSGSTLDTMESFPSLVEAPTLYGSEHVLTGSRKDIPFASTGEDQFRSEGQAPQTLLPGAMDVPQQSNAPTSSGSSRQEPRMIARRLGVGPTLFKTRNFL